MKNEPAYAFRTAADGTVHYEPVDPGGFVSRWWFTGAFLVICALLGAGAVALTSSGTETGSGGAVMAERACKDFVKDRLKSPSSADFSATSSAGTGTVTVTGVVDSDNSFGASLRSTYTCTVVDQGSAGWHLQNLEVL
jgi:hypothetical protein